MNRWLNMFWSAQAFGVKRMWAGRLCLRRSSQTGSSSHFSAISSILWLWVQGLTTTLAGRTYAGAQKACRCMRESQTETSWAWTMLFLNCCCSFYWTTHSFENSRNDMIVLRVNKHNIWAACYFCLHLSLQICLRSFCFGPKIELKSKILHMVCWRINKSQSCFYLKEDCNFLTLMSVQTQKTFLHICNSNEYIFVGLLFLFLSWKSKQPKAFTHQSTNMYQSNLYE